MMMIARTPFIRDTSEEMIVLLSLGSIPPPSRIPDMIETTCSMLQESALVSYIKYRFSGTKPLDVLNKMWRNSSSRFLHAATSTRRNSSEICDLRLMTDNE